MVNIILLISLINSDPNVGTHDFDYLKITLPARQAAMGGVGIALPDNAFGFLFNPAGLVDIEGERFGTTYMNYLAGIQLGTISYSRPMADKGIGIGITYLNSGSMKKTDIYGNEQGTFSVSYANLDASFGFLIPKYIPIPILAWLRKKVTGDTAPVAFGIGIKGLYGKIDTFFSMGACANLGFYYFWSSLKGLRTGVVIRNLGLVFKSFRNTEETTSMPVEYGGSFNYSPNDKFNISLDLIDRPFFNYNIRVGMEAWVNKFIALRAGYNSLGSDLQTGSGSDILAGLGFGLGVKVSNYQLDYGFTPMLVLGRVHRITLSFAI